MVRRTARFPLPRRIALALLLGFAPVLGAVAVASALLDDPLWIVLATALVGVPLGLLAALRALRTTLRSVDALRELARALEEGDLSLKLPQGRGDSLGELYDAVNQVSAVVREERESLHQREWMLGTVLHTTPLAILLANARERVVFSNREARRLLSDGRRLEGRRLDEVLDGAPAALREALSGGADSLFRIELDGQEESFHVSQRAFQLTMQPHTLITVRRMTPELRREEVAIWKKVIRVISHELNNSLAPIGSLAHSARLAVKKPEHAHRLDEVFDTIEDRVAHLQDFLGKYARFAKLPAPVREDVALGPFVDRLERIAGFRLVGERPTGVGCFDAGQLEQALINLVKNAREAGGPEEEVTLAVTSGEDGAVTFEVCDRGRGMSDDELQQALRPFHSSKEGGAGLGLPLAVEIVDAHRGSLRLARRQGGGTRVVCKLPGRGLRSKEERTDVVEGSPHDASRSV